MFNLLWTLKLAKINIKSKWNSKCKQTYYSVINGIVHTILWGGERAARKDWKNKKHLLSPGVILVHILCIWYQRPLQNSWTSFNITRSKAVQLHKIGVAVSSAFISNTLFPCSLELFPLEWQLNTTEKTTCDCSSCCLQNKWKRFLNLCNGDRYRVGIALNVCVYCPLEWDCSRAVLWMSGIEIENRSWL